MASSWVGVRCGSMCAGTVGRSAWAAAVGACAKPGITMIVLLACFASDVPGRTTAAEEGAAVEQPAGCGCFPTPHPADCPGGSAARRPGVEGGGRRSCLMKARTRECPDLVCGTSRVSHFGSRAANRSPEPLERPFELIEHPF